MTDSARKPPVGDDDKLPLTLRQTQSGIELEPFYRPADPDAGTSTYRDDLGDPGTFPFTRGPHASMYRGKPWTMRMFSGFGTPEDTNRRFKFLLSHAQTGLSAAFDKPTPIGRHPDNPHSIGHRGRQRVAHSSLDYLLL